MPLDDYKPLLTNLATGLAGAAAGGGLTYMGSNPMEGEGDDDFSTRRSQNAVSGAIAGGALGAATPSLVRAGQNLTSQSGISKALGVLGGGVWPGNHPLFAGIPEGAAAGGAAGMWAGRLGAKLNGTGAKIDKFMDQLKADVAGTATKLMPAGNPASAEAIRLKQIETAMQQERGLHSYQKIFRGPAEKFLRSEHVPPGMFAGRAAGRVGAIAGAVGVPLVSYMGSQ